MWSSSTDVLVRVSLMGIVSSLVALLSGRYLVFLLSMAVLNLIDSWVCMIVHKDRGGRLDTKGCAR